MSLQLSIVEYLPILIWCLLPFHEQHKFCFTLVGGMVGKNVEIRKFLQGKFDNLWEIMHFQIKKYIRNSGKYYYIPGKYTYFPALVGGEVKWGGESNLLCSTRGELIQVILAFELYSCTLSHSVSNQGGKSGFVGNQTFSRVVNQALHQHGGPDISYCWFETLPILKFLFCSLVTSKWNKK